MAELEESWLPFADAPNDVDVDKLDFSFVESCSDWKLLYNILRVLRSGKEGFYPDLERVAESKLLSEMPAKLRQRYLALKSSATVDQIAEAEEDLFDWQSKATKIDEGLKEKRDVGKGSAKTVHDQPHWHFLQRSSGVQAAKIVKLRSDLKTLELSELQLERKAELERRKGNECYKAGEYPEALANYSKSIAFQDTNSAAWANRAMAYMKTEVFDLAEVDCTVALLLDPQYKKARSRRGLVRFKQGKYKEAAEDFNVVLLQSAHGDAEAQAMLRKTLDKFREVEGYELILGDGGESDAEEVSININVRPSAFKSVESVACEMHDLFMPVATMHAWKTGELVSYRVQPIDSAGFVRVQIEADSDEESEGGEEAEDGEETSSAEVPQPVTIDVEADHAVLLALRLKDEGNELVRAGKYTEAVTCYDASLQAHRSVLTLNNRAQAKLNCKDFLGALADTSAVLDAEPQNSKALFRRAKAWLGVNDPETCLKDVVALLGVEPDSAAAAELQAQAQAQRARSETLKSDGNQAMGVGDLERAISLYSQAVQIDCRNFAALNNRALAFIKIGDVAKAIADATVVIERCPSKLLRDKALFRRADARYGGPTDEQQIHLALQDIEALGDAPSALTLDLKTKILDLLQEMKSPALHPPAAVPVIACATPAAALASVASPSSQKIPMASSPAPKAPKSPKVPTSAIKATVPDDPPRTLYEFERVWRSLSSQPALQAQYLAIFKSSTFKKIFKEAIASEMLGSVFVALQAHGDANSTHRVLAALSSVPSLSFALTMLPRAEGEVLRGLLASLKSCSTVSAADLDALKRKFKC